MIILKKLNGEEFVLNSELIETIMETPDTTILLTNGKHLIVREHRLTLRSCHGAGPWTKLYQLLWQETHRILW